MGILRIREQKTFQFVRRHDLFFFISETISKHRFHQLMRAIETDLQRGDNGPCKKYVTPKIAIFDPPHFWLTLLITKKSDKIWRSRLRKKNKKFRWVSTGPFIFAKIMKKQCHRIDGPRKKITSNLEADPPGGVEKKKGTSIRKYNRRKWIWTQKWFGDRSKIGLKIFLITETTSTS